MRLHRDLEELVAAVLRRSHGQPDFQAASAVLTAVGAFFNGHPYEVSVHADVESAGDAARIGRWLMNPSRVCRWCRLRESHPWHDDGSEAAS
jgi:hypothetical protein